MSWFESVSPKAPLSNSAKPIFDTAAMAQMGAMSPLWMLFFSASAAGMAYWSMTSWMRLAAPERMAENVVKLRLVKPEPAPAIEAVVPGPIVPELAMVEPAVIEPVVAEIGAVSVVMPEPVAQVAADIAPDLIKTPSKPKAPKVAKSRLLKPAAPPVTAPIAAEPPAAPKAPARRGRPPKALAPQVDVQAVPVSEPAAKAKSPVVMGARVKAAVKSAPVAKAPTPGAKRGPKPKPKA